MSLSNPRTSQSPVQRHFSLKMSTGHVTYYDKAAQKEVEVEAPFRFLVLDTLNFIGGFNEPSNSGIWSNEVRNTRQETLTVRSKKGIIATGLYDAIKGDVKDDGGKFGNSVYIAYKDGDEYALGNIKFLGAGLSKWFDFRQGKNLDLDPGVAVTGWTEEKKGRNEYFAPVFDSLKVSDEAVAAAKLLDQQLQAYLSSAPSSQEESRQEYSAPAPSFAGPPVQGGFGDNYDSEPPF